MNNTFQRKNGLTLNIWQRMGMRRVFETDYYSNYKLLKDMYLGFIFILNQKRSQLAINFTEQFTFALFICFSDCQNLQVESFSSFNLDFKFFTYFRANKEQTRWKAMNWSKFLFE